MSKHAKTATPPIKSLLLGMTGSVSTLLMPQAIFLLRQAFAQEVHIVTSQSVQQFLTPYALEICSGNPVFSDSFQQSAQIKLPHLDLVAQADLFVVMPTTANLLAKAAHGICDSLLTTAIVASQQPVVFVPSMNEVMWTSRVVQRNVTLLRELGHHVIEPGKGYEISTMLPMVGTMPPINVVLMRLIELMQSAEFDVQSSKNG